MRPEASTVLIALAMLSVAAAPRESEAPDLELLEFLGGIDLAPDAIEEIPEFTSGPTAAQTNGANPTEVEKQP